MRSALSSTVSRGHPGRLCAREGSRLVSGRPGSAHAACGTAGKTIDDLRRARDPARALAVPMVRRSIRAQGGVLEIMIGYSDSNKDGLLREQLGVVEGADKDHAASAGTWACRSRGFLPRARRVGEPRRPARQTRDRGVARKLVECALSRHRAGEVVSFKYANRRNGARTCVELLASGVLEHAQVGRGPCRKANSTKRWKRSRRIARRTRSSSSSPI